ncbi:hypothetical protein LA080_007519 [Diaporthe eres]|nr:hypothetical protein LA080_007519 [Diaporthe eres]
MDHFSQSCPKGALQTVTVSLRLSSGEKAQKPTWDRTWIQAELGRLAGWPDFDGMTDGDEQGCGTTKRDVSKHPIESRKLRRLCCLTCRRLSTAFLTIRQLWVLNWLSGVLENRSIREIQTVPRSAFGDAAPSR